MTSKPAYHDLPKLRREFRCIMRDVEPHWSMAKIEFTYECADCGTEIRQNDGEAEVAELVCGPCSNH